LTGRLCAKEKSIFFVVLEYSENTLCMSGKGNKIASLAKSMQLSRLHFYVRNCKRLEKDVCAVGFFSEPAIIDEGYKKIPPH
jgi:hypothetical protein